MLVTPCKSILIFQSVVWTVLPRLQLSMGNLGPGRTEQSPAQDVHVLRLIYVEISLLSVTQLTCVQVCFNMGADHEVEGISRCSPSSLSSCSIKRVM